MKKHMTFDRLSAALLAPKRTSLAMAVGLAAAVLPLASHAAPVTWGTWTAVTDNTAIQTTSGYTTYGGVNFNGSNTAINNGPGGSGGTEVAFTGVAHNASGTAAGITVANASFGFQSTGNNSNVSSAVGSPQNWGTVLDRVIGGAPGAITLSGLTSGSSYYVQFFSSAPDANILANSKITSGGVDSPFFGNHASGGTKYIIATFTADATSQSFVVSGEEPTYSALVIGVQPAGASGTITATGSLSSFTTNVGTASAAQSSVSVSGSGLTEDITATAPSGFEVSADDVTYAGTATFTQSDGSVASTPLYVRLSAAAALGSYTNPVVLSSSGATSVNVAASGTVYPECTWILNGDGNWSTNANWSGGVIADGVGKTAYFTTAFGGNRNVTLDSNHTVGILNLSVTGGSLNIVSSGPVLTLDNTGSTAAQINMTTAQNMALGTLPLELQDSLVINQNISHGTGKDLALGTISSTNGSLTIEHHSTFADGQTRFDGIISNGSGSIAFTQTSGRSIFNAANTYTDATTLNGGTLKLGTAGSLDNGTSVSIAAGATFDLTVPTSSSGTYTWNATSLSASGAASPATIAGTAGGIIDMGSTPISVTTDGTNPCLTVTGATLTLDGNQFTVVTGSLLVDGVYTLVSADSPISGTVNSTALYGGSGLAGGASGEVSISGNTVVLTVTGASTVSVTGSLAPFVTNSGTASAAQTVSVSGTNLTADITATAPLGFEVSADDSTYAGTATFTPSGGSVASTPLYVRLSAAATAGSYADNVAVTSTGANTVNVAASGTVYPPPGDGTWTDNPGSWGTPDLWVGNQIAGGAGATADFQITVGSSRIVTLDGDRTIGILKLGFFPTNKGLTLNAGTGGKLILDNGGGNALISFRDGGGNVAINPAVELRSNLLINNLDNGGDKGFWFAGGISSTNGNLTITNTSDANSRTKFNSVVSDGTAGNSITFVQTAGWSEFNAANSYTGATTINGGLLRLSATGSLANATSVSIAAGATLDLTLKTTSSATYTWNTTSLSASGTATPATISGTAGGTIDMGATPISLTWAGASSGIDSTHPSLTVTGATLALDGNQLTVVVPGTALDAGVYTLVSAASITGTVAPTALYTGGNGLVGGATGVVSISGVDTVILTVTTGATYAGWASANGVAGLADVDSDNDGVSNGIEYFMNILSSDPVFTASPALNGANTITWTNGGNIPPSAYGTQYVVQTSDNLADWFDVPSGNLTNNTQGPGGLLTYTLTGDAPRFVRLKVTPN